jgi:hypothetical protein
VHLGMLKLLYEFARQQGITDLLALALPELQAVYTVAFFIQLDIIIEHPTWGPTHVMHFDMAHTERLHGSSKHPVARLLFQTNVPNVLL